MNRLQNTDIVFFGNHLTVTESPFSTFDHNGNRSSLEPPNVANTVFERYCLSLSHGVDVGQIKLRPNKESISAVVDPLTSSSEKVVVDKHSNADEFRFR